MSAQVPSLESYSEAGPSGTIINLAFNFRLLFIAGDSGIRRRISRLVLLFIGRRIFTHSLPYPDRPPGLAVAIFAAGLQLPGADVPVRHDPVVPFLC